jgi:hypothetical protein
LGEEIFEHDWKVMLVVFSTINKPANLDLALLDKRGLLKHDYAKTKQCSSSEAERQTAVAIFGVANTS